MSDMIERVARAMCEEDGANWNAANFNETANGDEPEEQREYWRAKTRAALSELLSPSTAMLIAGVKAMRNPDLDVTEKELALGWRAMISKAMEG